MQEDKIWERNYSILGDYISRNDRLPDPSENIHNWILAQRYLYKKGKLSEEKMEKLESLFHWIWDPNVAKWEEIYQEVLKYTQIHGHLPNKKANPRLNRWLLRQNNAKRLEKWKRDLLEKLPKYTNTVKNVEDILWEERYHSLKRHSHVLEIIEDNASDLSVWIHEQKDNYQKNLLKQDKIDLLEKIPKWTWKKREITSIVTKIKEYVEINGKLPGRSGDRKSLALRKWIEKQKTKYAKGMINPEEIKDLESIKGWEWRSKKRKLGDDVITSSKKVKLE